MGKGGGGARCPWSHNHAGQSGMLQIVADYAVPNVAEKIARLIISYTDYVNRVVWRKAN